jgi:hypothetical protein
MGARGGSHGPRLSRRGLLGGGLALLAGAWAGRGAAAAAAEFAAQGGQVPGAAPPEPPASYALQEALARGRAGLVERLDPDAGGRPYFELNLGGAQPYLAHDCWDYVDVAGRMVDALALADTALGSDDGAASRESVLAYLRARQGTEGLFWNGPNDREGGYASDCVESFCQSRAALGLVTWLQASGADAAAAALDRLVAGLGAVAVWDGDAAYFPGSQWRNSWLEQTLTADGAPDGRAKYGWGSLVVLPLARYVELTGAPAAWELTAALLRFFVERSGLVAADGSFAGHVHAEGYAAIASAAARFATLAGWDAWLAWAARLFEYLRGRSTRYGFVPDRIGLGPSYYWYWYGRESLPPTCETCGLVDALELGITLAERGYTEYWDDVERWTRNHLLASQLGTPDTWAAAPGQAAPAALVAACAPDAPLGRVVAGAFDSASSPGGLLDQADDGQSAVVEGCCANSGLRGLFLAWQHAVADDGTVVSVHLGLSRTSPAVEVVSYEPSAGRLDVRLRAARRLRVRVPSWVARETLVLLRDDERIAPTWDGDYLRVDDLAPGQTVSLRYPLGERTEEEQIDGARLQVRWRGGTVLGVEPGGAWLDAYGRRPAAAPLAAPPLPPRASRIVW